MAKPLTCKELLDQLIEYLEGELDEHARRLCDEHLDLCQSCVDYFESYLATTQLACGTYAANGPGPRATGPQGIGPGATEPAELPEDLVQSILRAAGVPPSGKTGSLLQPGETPGGESPGPA